MLKNLYKFDTDIEICFRRHRQTDTHAYTLEIIPTWKIPQSGICWTPCAHLHGIVANDLLKSFVQGQAEQQDDLGGHMATCLYSTLLWYKSCRLHPPPAVTESHPFQNKNLILHHVHDHSISCLNVTYLFPVFPHSVSDLWLPSLNEVSSLISFCFWFGNN